VSGIYVRTDEDRVLFLDEQPSDGGPSVCDELGVADNTAIVNHALRRAGLRSQVNCAHLLGKLAGRPAIVSVSDRSGLPEAAVLAWWLSEIGADDLENVKRDWGAATPEQEARHQAGVDFLLQTVQDQAAGDEALAAAGAPGLVATVRRLFRRR